ncbi:MAG: segregation/condensation protein A [Oscillospiraceae bacterium]|nr:segregation/condensation protein A [Oscillospiraceae bacterium]
MTIIPDLTFRLEGVVRSRGDMEDFEGPLALILQLLSKNKIEICDVKISLILDQYLAWMDEMRSMDLEITSAFMEMASHLMYIKARTLLTGDEEPSELETLRSSLMTLKNREYYARIKEQLEWFARRAQAGFTTFARAPIELKGAGLYRYSHEPSELAAAMAQLADRTDGSGAPAPGIVMPTRVTYPLGQKTEELLTSLRDRGKMTLREVFAACGDRSELVASFIAVLEICRSGAAELTETENGWEMAFVPSAAGREEANEDR